MDSRLSILFSKKLNRNDLFVIAANLIPLIGVGLWNWSAVDVFTAYALETLIIGAITVIQLTIGAVYKGKDTWYSENQKVNVSGFFFVFFFIFHYGLFAAVQTSIFSQVAGITKDNKGLLHFFFHWYDYINNDMLVMLSGFAISNLVISLWPFVKNEEYKKLSLIHIMFKPYGRIFIQQITVILGSMFLLFKLGFLFILVFVAVKISVEVFFDFETLLGKEMEKIKQKSGEQ